MIIYIIQTKLEKNMSKKYMTKYEAIQAEKDWLLINQHPSENHDITFEQLYTLFLEHQKDKVKVTTYYDYHNYWKHLKGLYKLKVINFSHQDYEAWKKEMNKKNLATKTKNSTLKFLKSMINFADKWYDINIHSL